LKKRMDAVKSVAAAATLLLIIAGCSQPGHAGQRDTRSCLFEVLHSEELPIGPLFYHTIKTVLLVSAPDTPPFETTIFKVIPWQAPPPRRGQRVRAWCDPKALKPSFGLF